MLGPIFRSLSTFVFVIGFFAGCSGAYALIFQNAPSRFAVMMGIGVVAVIAALKMREASGELNLVALTPEDMAHQFEISLALGMGAHAPAGATALAGAAAAALIVIAIAFLGWLTPSAFVVALVLFAVYGAVLALIKKNTLQKGALIVKDGKRFGAHRRLSLIFIPVLIVVWLAASAPEIDPVIMGIIILGLLWWTGAAFHRAWELLHTTFLVLMFKEKSPRSIRWGLQEWLRYTRSEARARQVAFDDDGSVTLYGEFDNPDELRRELLRLDFITRVNLVQEPAATG